MFGYTIIRKDRLEQLEKDSLIVSRLYTYLHWFTGWPHVQQLLCEFAFGNVGATTVSSTRHQFAKAMGTDEYGEPIKEKADEST